MQTAGPGAVRTIVDRYLHSRQAELGLAFCTHSCALLLYSRNSTPAPDSSRPRLKLETKAPIPGTSRPRLDPEAKAPIPGPDTDPDAWVTTRHIMTGDFFSRRQVQIECEVRLHQT